MDKFVSVNRLIKSGMILVNPQGTFKGYGAYVGISPYHKLDSSTTPIELGKVVLKAMEQAGPTGYHIRDIDKYRDECEDATSRRIREEFLSLSGSLKKAERNLIKVTVEQAHGTKSWLATRFKGDEKLDSHTRDTDVRVKHTNGPEGLGKALFSLFAVDS